MIQDTILQSLCNKDGLCGNKTSLFAVTAFSLFRAVATSSRFLEELVGEYCLLFLGRSGGGRGV